MTESRGSFDRVGDTVAARRLAEYTDKYRREPLLGCSLVAHRDLGFCAGCVRDNGTAHEVTAWRLLAMAERGIPAQPSGGDQR